MADLEEEKRIAMVLVKASCEFQGESLSARESCREEYRAKESSFDNILRVLVDGQIGVFAQVLGLRQFNPKESTQYQLGIAASFIRTHFIVGDMILNGDLIESLILIRKQLESLVRLHELDKKPLEKLAGKVPNIKNVLKCSTGSLYGDLSEVAHFSKPRVSLLMQTIQRGDEVGPSLIPCYQENLKAAFDMQHFISIYFLAWMAQALPSWRPGYDNKKDWDAILRVVRMAKETGVINFPEEA